MPTLRAAIASPLRALALAAGVVGYGAAVLLIALASWIEAGNEPETGGPA